MKHFSSTLLASTSVACALLLSNAASQAAPLLSWDPGATGTISDGAGNWQSGTETKWASGGVDMAWIPWADASIGTLAGAANYDISVKLAVNVGNITFNQMTSPGKYTVLATATLTIGGTVTVNNTSGQTYMGKGTIVSSNNVPNGYVTFTKDGAGTLRLSSATLVTTANPAVEIINGTLQIAGFDNNLPTAGVLQVDSAGIFDLAGVNQTLAALSGSGAVKNSTGTSTLTVGNNDTSGSFSGRSSSGSGVLNLMKIGAGTQTMNGTAAWVHTGPSTINGGSLIFATGANCPNSSFTVNSGAGNTLGVELAAAGGQWACSNLVFGLADAGTYALSIDYNNTTPSATTAPLVCSNLTPHSTITLTVSGFASGFATMGTYPLISYNPTSPTPLSSGQFADFTLAALPSGYLGYLSNDTANFVVSLQITHVPCTETVTMSPSSPLPDGAVDVGYSQTFTGGGGTGPYSFSIVAGGLPSGLNLDPGGLLSGTTTNAGTFNFTVQVADTAAGCFNNYDYSLTIAPGAIASYTVTAPSPQVQYNPFTVTVVAKDADGNTVTTDSTTQVTMSSDTGNVRFDSNGDGTYGDATKTLSGGMFTIQAADNAAESVGIIATDANTKTGTSSSITINPPAALTWDPGKTPATGSDASGSWTAGTAIWATGGADVAWVPGANALIGVGGTPNTATIKTYPVTVANITFNQIASGGYTLSAANVPTVVTFNGGTVTVNNTGGATLTKLTLTGAVTFTKDGSGMLGLSSCTSTYTGRTVVAHGMLRILNQTQQLPPTAPMEVDATATLDLNSKDQIVDALTGSGTVDNTSTAGSSSLTVGYNNGSGAFSGVLQNTGAGKTLALTKAGTGTQTLSSVNTYAGYTTISGGTLALGSSGSIANSTRIIIGAGGMLDVSAIASYAPGVGTTNLYASGTGTAVGTTAAAVKGGTSVDLSAVNRIVLTNDSVHPSLYISQGALSLNNNTFYVYNDGSYTVLPDGDYTIVQQASGSISGTVAASNVTGDAVAGKSASVSIVGGTVMLHVCTPPTTSSITGLATVTANQAGVTYSVTSNAGSTYAWTVPTDASIATGQGSSSITVNFGTTSGNVTVTETGATGCAAAPVSLAVTVLVPPVVSGQAIVGGNFQLTFSGPSGQTWRIMTSTNVVLPFGDWTLLSNGTFTGSPVTVTDLDGTTAPGLFYRVTSP